MPDSSVMPGDGIDDVDRSDSDGSEHYEDDESHASGSDIDGSRGLLDLEAEESGRSDAESDFSSAGHDGSEHSSFPQFSSLPFELRARIWEMFCPDLRTAQPCVFEFDATLTTDGSIVSLGPGNLLQRQTESRRAVMATHHESREMAHKAFPHMLLFDNRGNWDSDQIRNFYFNAQKDIFLFTLMSPSDFRYEMPPIKHKPPHGFLRNIQHLGIAMTYETLPTIAPMVLDNDLSLPNLKSAFLCYDDYDIQTSELRWCALDSTHRFRLEFSEENEVGINEELENLYCWPSCSSVCPGLMARITMDLDFWSRTGIADGRETSPNQLSKQPRLPMVKFSYEEGRRRFERLLKHRDSEKYSDSESNTDSTSTSPPEDEYESEEGDDGSIDDSRDSGDDLDALEVHSKSSSRSTLADASPSPDASAGLIDPEDMQGAHFSSPEPRPSEVEQEAGESASSDGIALPVARRPKRRMVISDEESDSDAEDQGPTSFKRARAMKPSRPAVVLDLKSESDAEREGTSSAEEAERRPISFLERLRREREEHPLPPSGSESEASGEGMGFNDYDASIHADFQDDEEGDGLEHNSDGAAEEPDVASVVTDEDDGTPYDNTFEEDVSW